MPKGEGNVVAQNKKARHDYSSRYRANRDGD